MKQENEDNKIDTGNISKLNQLINSQSKKGTTPLHLAAQQGHDEVVEMLLECGALTDTKDIGGSTPLHRAAKNGHAKVAILLLKHGANKEALDNVVCLCNISLRCICTLVGHHCIVQQKMATLIAGACANLVDDVIGWAPIHRAASDGRERVVQLLLEAGANIHAKDNV
ncbi:hypothetical protein THRCLA_10567 [Thraustotheca clavata]|uniref:Uncharacterized protein n=1 Tax=Thraustotheca clavata TaxID=74557 RepID=A0A1V9YKB2_9STRA|nr:hypothetical protein THRCLA_10567 [Thraustotheca clavata]